MRNLILAVLFFAFNFGAICQTKYFVSPSGNNGSNGLTQLTPYLTIQFAINNATPGDTVILMPGIYSEQLNVTKSLTMGSLGLLSPNLTDVYAENTIISGTGLTTQINFTSNAFNRLFLYGITIKNCQGQALNMSSITDSKIERVRFIDNGNLGASVININGNTKIENCYFKGNQFASLIVLGAQGSHFPVVNACQFENNGIPGQISKSLIYIGSRAIISNNLIYNNYGYMLNGGCNGPFDSLLVMNNTIVGNQGYGFVLDHCSGGVNGFVYNNIIENNSQGCLAYVSNAGGFSIIRLRNNKLFPNPYYTQNPMQYSLTWENNDTISGFTFVYPITNISGLSLPNYSNSIGSGTLFNLSYLQKDFYGNSRPFPSASNIDRGAVEHVFSTPANAPPLLNQPSAFNGFEDQPGVINLTGLNDGDFFSTQSLFLTASSGNLSVIDSFQFNYTQGQSIATLSFIPLLNTSGIVPITLKIKDDGGVLNGGIDSTTYTFNVTIQAVNDSPVALNDTANCSEDNPTAINILGNDSDVDNALLLNSIDLNLSIPGIQTSQSNSFGFWSINPAGLLLYNPALNFNGAANIQYAVSDQSAAVSNIAQVQVYVSPVNDPPIANNDSFSTDEDTPISFSILANDTDVDSPLGNLDLDPFTNGLQTFMQTPEGSWTVDAAGLLSFVPVLNYNGTAFLTYCVTDTFGLVSNHAVISVLVLPVNDSPETISLSSSSINENSLDVIGIFSATDIDLNQTFSYSLVSGPGDTDNGSFTIINNQLQGTTVFDYESTSQFSIRVKVTDQGGLTAEAVFIIYVINVNDIQVSEIIENTYCNGSTGSIQITPTNTNGNVSFQWDGPNGFSSNDQNIGNLEIGQYALMIADSFHSANFSFFVNEIPFYNQLSICYITGDTMPGNHNRIFFNNPGAFNVQFFQVLRESAVQGSYDFLGQVPSTESSFLDLISNNQVQSFNYKVRSVDSCGNFSSESDAHKTMLLQANLSSGNSVNLTWTPYVGASYNTYFIYRSVNNGIFDLLATIPASQLSFNDISANVELNEYLYFVAILLPNCDFNRTENLIRSNTKRLLHNGSTELSVLPTQIIFPNPASEWLYFENNTDEAIEKIRMFDKSGKCISEYSFFPISVTSLSEGIYYVEIVFQNGEILRKKMVKI